MTKTKPFIFILNSMRAEEAEGIRPSCNPNFGNEDSNQRIGIVEITSSINYLYDPVRGESLQGRVQTMLRHILKLRCRLCLPITVAGMALALRCVQV